MWCLLISLFISILSRWFRMWLLFIASLDIYVVSSRLERKFRNRIIFDTPIECNLVFVGLVRADPKNCIETHRYILKPSTREPMWTTRNPFCMGYSLYLDQIKVKLTTGWSSPRGGRVPSGNIGQITRRLAPFISSSTALRCWLTTTYNNQKHWQVESSLAFMYFIHNR